MLGDIVEAVRGVVGEVDGFMRECGGVRECDLADASLVLEARAAVPDSVEETGEVARGAMLLLAPTLDGEGFAAVLRWLAGRATVKYVAGEGAEVALGLEFPGIERVLGALERVALKPASALGPRRAGRASRGPRRGQAPPLEPLNTSVQRRKRRSR